MAKLTLLKFLFSTIYFVKECPYTFVFDLNNIKGVCKLSSSFNNCIRKHDTFSQPI